MCSCFGQQDCKHPRIQTFEIVSGTIFSQVKRMTGTNQCRSSFPSGLCFPVQQSDYITTTVTSKPPDASISLKFDVSLIKISLGLKLIYLFIQFFCLMRKYHPLLYSQAGNVYLWTEPNLDFQANRSICTFCHIEACCYHPWYRINNYWHKELHLQLVQIDVFSLKSMERIYPSCRSSPRVFPYTNLTLWTEKP